MRVLVTGGSGFIGTNLIAKLAAAGNEILNLDVTPPRNEALLPYHRSADIVDVATLSRLVSDFRPTDVVHLAALATFEASREMFLAVNVQGTANLLRACLQSGSSPRVLIASTQYVNGPGTPFDDDQRFHPVNAYGESKMQVELVTRKPDYECIDWSIVRPSNIWGPHHPRFPQEMWRYIARGFYLQPGFDPIIRAYGYIENVVAQIEVLLTAPAERVRHRVFYLTDPPIDSYEFLNTFSLALRNAPLRRVPRVILRTMARVGDALTMMGVRAPFSTGRYHRMISPHLARYEDQLWLEYGYAPVPLQEAVDRTVAWLRESYPNYYH